MHFSHALDSLSQILVVCTGNICRSPMGEVVLRDRLSTSGLDLDVVSAGVSAEEDGNPIYPPAQRRLREGGFEVPTRRAHRVTREEMRGSGLILAMTSAHARALGRLAIELGVDTSRIHLWREFDGTGLQPLESGCLTDDGNLRGDLPSNDSCDVPDPWYTDDFEATFQTVVAGADGLVTALTASEG